MNSEEGAPLPSAGGKRWLRLDRFDCAVLFIAAAILSYQLIIPPIVGLVDNGDFVKIMGYAGLAHHAVTPEDRYFRYVNSKFEFAQPGYYKSGLLSSETPVVAVAREIGLFVSKDGLFDIRVLSALHAILFLFALALILSATRALHVVPRRLLALLFIFMFTDVGYVSLFNTIYSQTASFLFLLMLAGFLALILSGQSNGALPFFGFLFAVFLFVSSKPQETVMAPLLAFVVMRASMTLRSWKWWQATAVALVLILFAGRLFMKTPTYFKQALFYNVVFTELLPNSPSPRADLEALGVSGDLVKYSGTNAFMKDSPCNLPWFQAAFFSKVHYPTVLWFYLSHPRRFWGLLTRSATKAFTLRPPGYGNFEKSSGFPERTPSAGFQLWSKLKTHILPGSLWTLILFFSGNLTAVVLVLWRRTVAPGAQIGLEAFGILNVMAISAFFVCTLGDSLYDVVRHLFSFNAMTDLILLIDVVCLVGVCCKRWDKAFGTE